MRLRLGRYLLRPRLRLLGCGEKKRDSRKEAFFLTFPPTLFCPAGMVYFCYNSSCPDAQLPRVSYQQCATGSNNGCSYAPREPLSFAALRSFFGFFYFLFLCVLALSSLLLLLLCRISDLSDDCWQQGDILCFDTTGSGSISHVGMYAQT